MELNYCLLTNDVETTSIWFNTLRDKTGEKVLNEGMPQLIELYNFYNIKSTFFYTGYIAKKLPELVKMIIPYGHEIASHGKSHLPHNGFDIMPFEKQKKHLEYSKKLLEDLSGKEVISFRSPALRVNCFTAKALIDNGYLIDSSIASQRFDFFLSFGSANKLKWIVAPRLPYKTSCESLFKKGNGPLIEVPLSALFFPYVGTTMRIFPLITSFQRKVNHLENKFNGKPIIFDIHPNEFIDESNEPRVINKRTNNKINFLIQDLLRAKLKTKNLGKSAFDLYEKEIKFYLDRGYKFITIKDYCKETGLL